MTLNSIDRSVEKMPSLTLTTSDGASVRLDRLGGPSVALFTRHAY